MLLILIAIHYQAFAGQVLRWVHQHMKICVIRQRKYMYPRVWATTIMVITGSESALQQSQLAALLTPRPVPTPEPLSILTPGGVLLD